MRRGSHEEKNITEKTGGKPDLLHLRRNPCSSVFYISYNIFRLLSVTTHKNWLLSLLRNPLLSFSHIFILLSDQAIIIARNTPTHSYSLFPAPIPTFSITSCSGSCSLVRSAAAIAAPVGVTNSPSTFVICNFK